MEAKTRLGQPARQARMSVVALLMEAASVVVDLPFLFGQPLVQVILGWNWRGSGGRRHSMVVEQCNAQYLL